MCVLQCRDFGWASVGVRVAADTDLPDSESKVVEDAVLAEETQTITAYATELATTFHAFYRDARVVDPAEPERSAKRLALADATRITLANALGLLGISAPDSM